MRSIPQKPSRMTNAELLSGKVVTARGRLRESIGILAGHDGMQHLGRHEQRMGRASLSKKSVQTYTKKRVNTTY